MRTSYGHCQVSEKVSPSTTARFPFEKKIITRLAVVIRLHLYAIPIDTL